MRSALPSSAWAISCAPRQMPSTGRPRACASAISSRSRSSGASPSVPSGLTMPPSTIRPSNDPAGGSGCESACQVTVRTPSAASGGSSAASGESRSCWTTSTVGFALTLSSSPIGARGGADSRWYARCAQACCWRWDCSTSSGARPTWRSASRVETMPAAGRRRPALRPRRAAHAGGAGGARARSARGRAGREMRGRRHRRHLDPDRRRRRRDDHRGARALEPDGRARLDDLALGRRLPRARGRAHRARRRSRAPRSASSA